MLCRVTAEPTRSTLWDAMEYWCRRRNKQPEHLANYRTLVKIRDGELPRSDVLKRIEVELGWENGHAKRAVLEGIPPEPIDGDARDEGDERVEVMRTLGDAIAATPEATAAAIQQARRLADQIVRTLRSPNGSTS